MDEQFKNQNILGRDIVDEMQESYLSYAMSVIISRALPDVRDGLKLFTEGFYMVLQKLEHSGIENIKSQQE